MADAKRKEMTHEEFLLWCLDQEERFELVDGFPVPLRAMAGASDPHDSIVVNLIALLKTALKGTGCRPKTADTALRTAIKRTRRPDVTVDCTEVARASYEARNPIAVLEILSPTTRKIDRNVKLEEYKRHPSLRTIVHIDPDIMDVLVYRRSPNGEWETERLEAPDAMLRLDGTPAALALSDIYDGVLLQVVGAVPEE